MQGLCTEKMAEKCLIVGLVHAPHLAPSTDVPQSWEELPAWFHALRPDDKDAVNDADSSSDFLQDSLCLLRGPSTRCKAPFSGAVCSPEPDVLVTAGSDISCSRTCQLPSTKPV